MKIRVFVGVMLLALAAVPAFADAIYTYTGAGFANIVGTPGEAGSNVSGSITFSSALPNSMPLTNVPSVPALGLVSFSFSDGVDTYSNIDLVSQLQLGTDSLGHINAWSLVVLNVAHLAQFSASSFDGDTAQGCTPSGSIFVCSLEANTGGKTGTWTGPVVTTNVPEPSSLILLGTGLLGLVGSGLWRRLLA